MKQRATTRGNGGKARQRNTKGRQSRPRRSPADFQKQFREQACELAEARKRLSESLEQQTATSEVLRIISSSPGELEPVFAAMLEHATNLCEAGYGAMWLREGHAFRTAALHGALPTAWTERWRSGTLFHPGPEVPMVQTERTRKPVQVDDLRASPAYLGREPLVVSAVDVAGI